MKTLACTLATTIAALVVIAGSAEAQKYRGPQRYQPSRPTISPYLNLFRTDGGDLPNYYTYVRPQLEQREFQQQQEFTNRRQLSVNKEQQTDLRRLDKQVLEIREAPMRATGTGGGFMNYSHYYSSGGNSAPSRHSRAPARR